MRKPKDCKLRIGNVVRTAIEGNVFKKVIFSLSKHRKLNYVRAIAKIGVHSYI